MPSIRPGIDGVPAILIPSDPAQFVSWFKSDFIPRWLAPGDVRNATPGPGITISGSIGSNATISASTTVQALFVQPYLLVGSPVAPAVLTGYRSIAAQVGVLALTDGGAESILTVGVAANGIGNTQLRQGAAVSVIGNSTSGPANVADIVASADGQVLQSSSGTLSFAALSPSSIDYIANNTLLGNISGSSAAPSAVALSSLTANPSASIGLSAVNGTAVTFMTSDSAPALSQAISPTWTGNHTFTPTSGVGATVNGASVIATDAFVVQGYTSAGGHGLRVNAGTASTDYCAIFDNAAATGADLMLIYGDGSVTVGAATGGAKGVGTINVASKYYVSGVAQPVFSAAITGYGTPTGGSHQSSFAAGSISLANLAAAVAQLIIDLKTQNLIAA